MCINSISFWVAVTPILFRVKENCEMSILELTNLLQSIENKELLVVFLLVQLYYIIS